MTETVKVDVLDWKNYDGNGECARSAQFYPVGLPISCVPPADTTILFPYNTRADHPAGSACLNNRCAGFRWSRVS